MFAVQLLILALYLVSWYKMFEKFGEFDSCEEINELSVNLSNEGDTDSIYALAQENGIPTVAITGERPNSISQYADLWFRVEDHCKLDDQNVRPNTFFPQALMLTELIAYEYHRLCSLPNEDRTDL